MKRFTNMLELALFVGIALVGCGGGGGGGGDAGGGTYQAIPTVTTLSASSVSGTAATLNASITANGLPTNAFFEYWSSGPIDRRTTPTQTISSTANGITISVVITGLQPYNTYHYRVISNNSLGDSFGSELSFISIPLDSQTPLVDAVVDKPSAYEGDIITLKGIATNPNKTIISYKWTQVAGPLGEFYENGTTWNTANFILPKVTSPEVIVINLRVTDNSVFQSDDNVSITVYPLKEISGPLFTDTVLTPQEGPYKVTNLLSVGSGVTLTILPGTMLKFYSGVELKVAGKLIAQGNETQPIFFGAMPEKVFGINGANQRWAGINFVGSDNSVIEYAVIEDCYHGIDLGGTGPVTISNNVFRYMMEGIYDSGGQQPMSISHNTFFGTYYAFYYLRPSTLSFIEYNRFIKDKSIVWENIIFEGGNYAGTTIIENNNFEETTGIVMRAPTLGGGIISVANNWWGTVDLSVISGLIYDKYDDATLEEIIYEPILLSAPINAGSPIPVDIKKPLPQ